MTGGRVHGGRSGGGAAGRTHGERRNEAIVGCIGRSGGTSELLAEYLGRLGGDTASGSVALGGSSLDVCRDEDDVATLRSRETDVDHRDRLGVGIARSADPAWGTGVCLGVDGAERVAVAGTAADAEALGTDPDGRRRDRRPASVVAEFVAGYRDHGVATERAVCSAADRLEAPYAFAATVADERAIYVAADGRPAAVGVADGAHVVSSDPRSLRAYANEVVPVDDGSVAVCWPDDWFLVSA